MPVAQHDLLSSRAIIGMFYERLEQMPPTWIDEIAMRMPSNQPSETYAFLGMSPQMQEWVGNRMARELREFSFEIKNKDHEATLKVHDKDRRRDKTGQLEIRIAELTTRAQMYPAKLLTDLIVAGESTVGYDGQFFFDTDHSIGDSGTIDNDLTFNAVSGSTPTVAEMRDAIFASVTAMHGYKDDRGEPINELASSFDIMVPVALWPQAVQAVNMPIITDGTAGSVNNILANLDGYSFRVRKNPRLTAATKFYTFRTDAPIKPFIVQEEMPLTPEALAEGSDFYFNERQFLFSISWSGNVGYGEFRYATQTTFT